MASTEEVRDQYIIETSIDDGVTAPADKIAASLNAVEDAATSATAAVKGAGDAVATAGAQLGAAGDDSNSAAAAYAKVQAAAAELAATQQELAAATAAGSAETDEAAAYTAALTARIQTLQAALPALRGEYETQAASQASWNGAMVQGAAAAQALAAATSAAAQAAAAGGAGSPNGAVASQMSAGADAANRLLASAKAAAQAVTDLGQAADGTGNLVTTSAASFDRLAARFDPVTRAANAQATAQRQLAAALDQVGRAEAAGVDLDTISRVIDTLSARVDAATTKFNNMSAAAAYAGSDVQAMFTEAAAAAQRLNDVQATVNNFAGVTAPTSSEDYAARAADIEAYGASLDQLRAKFDPVFAASKQYEATLGEIDTAVKLGALNETQAATARDLVTASFAKANQPLQDLTNSQNAHAASVGQAAFAMRQLEVQATQTFSGLATGQPVFMTLIQQGHQVFDVMEATGTSVSQLGQMVGAFALRLATNPVVLTVVGIAAAIGGIVALGAAAESTARQTAALQNQLSATRDDYAAMAAEATAAAKQIAATTPFSTADARSATATIAAAPQFQGNTEQLVALTKAAGDLATVLGTTLPQSAATFVQAMEDPAKVAQDMADKHLRGFTQALVDNVAQMQRAGDFAGGFTTVVNTLAQSTAGATDHAMTPLQKSLNDMSTAFTKSGQDGRSFADVAGTSITNAVAGSIDAISKLIGQINLLRGALGTLQSPAAAATQGAIQQNGMQVPWWWPLPAGPNGRAASPFAAPNPVAPNASLDPTIASQIYAQSQQQNPNNPYLANVQAAFGTQVVWHESRGQQSAVNPASGATGLFQLMPATAQGLGVNASDQAQNVQGGMTLIAQLWQKYKGDPTLVAMAYSWGTGNVDAFLAGVKTAAQVPAETQQFVQFMTGAGVPGASSAAAAVSSPAASPPPSIGSVIGGGGDVQAQVNASLKYVDTLNTIFAKQQALAAEAKDLATSLAIPGQTQDTYTKLSQGLDIIHGQQATLMTPVQQLTKGFRDQASVAGQDGSAAQKIADADLALDNASIAATGHDASQSDKEAAHTIILAGLSKELQNNVEQIGRQIVANENSLTATEQGGQALDDYNASVKAQTDALKYGKIGSDAYNAALITLTGSYQSQAKSQRDVTAATDIATFQKQIDLTTTEIGLIGVTVDQRNREIAVLQQRQKIGLVVGQQADAEQQKSIDDAAKAADLQTQLQRNQQAISDLSSTFTQSFDSIGQAITNSLIQGTGAAVNWKNVMTSAAQQVLDAFLKFTVLNPILNGLFGQNLTTGSTILSVLSGQSAAAASGSAAAGSAGAGASSAGTSSLASSGNLLSAGGLLSHLLPDNIIQSLGFSGSGGLFGGVNGLLNTTIIGPSAAQFGPVTSGLAADAAGLPASLTLGGLLGGAGLGFGAGALTNSLLGGNTTGGTIGSGVGSLAGAALGSLLLPGAGTIIGGLIGGMAGGAGGGLIGPPKQNSYSSTAVSDKNGQLDVGNTLSQLVDASQQRATAQAQADTLNAYLSASNLTLASIGNLTQVGSNTPGGFQDPSKYADINAAFSNFQFSSPDPNVDQALSGRSFSSTNDLQGFVGALTDFLGNLQNSNASAMAPTFVGTISGMSSTDAVAYLNAVGPAIQSFAANLQAAGTNASSTQAFLSNITTMAGSDAVSYLQAIGPAIQSFTTDIQNSGAAFDIQSYLQGLSSDLSSSDVVAKLQATDTFITQTVPALEKFGQVTGSLNDAIAQIHTEFDPAIATAQQLGYAEDALTTARQNAIQAAQAAADQQTAQNGLALGARFMTAAATLGTGVSPEDAALFSFDVSAQQQREQLNQQLVGLYGDAYQTTADYAQQMLTLEQTLSEERLVVQKQYADQALQTEEQSQAAIQAAQDKGAQSATSAVTSIAAYLQKIESGTQSPLSPQLQYSLASSQFNAVSGAAASGDFNSIQNITSYADALLSASRAVNGSGEAYTDDFNRVTTALSQITQLTPDTLTASAMASIAQTQTTALTTALQTTSDMVASLDRDMLDANGKLTSVFTDQAGNIVGGLIQNGNQITGTLGSLNSSVVGSLSAATTGVTGAIIDSGGRVVGEFKDQAGNIVGALVQQGNQIVGVYTDQTGTITGTFADGTAALANVFTDQSGNIVGGINQSGSVITGSLTSLSGALTGQLVNSTTDITGGLVDSGAQVIAEFKTQGGAIVGGLVQQGNQIVGVYTNQTGQIIGTFGTQLSTLNQSLLASNASLTSVFTDQAGDIVGGLVQNGAQITGSLTALNSSVTGSFTNATAGITGSIIDSGGQVVGEFKDQAGDIIGALVQQGNQITGVYTDQTGKIIGTFGDETSALSSVFVNQAGAVVGGIVQNGTQITGSLNALNSSVTGSFTSATAGITGSIIDSGGQVVGEFKDQAGNIIGALVQQGNQTIGVYTNQTGQIISTFGDQTNALSSVFTNQAGNIIGGLTTNGNQISGSLVSLDGSLTGSLASTTAGITGALIDNGGKVVDEFRAQGGAIVGGLVQQGNQIVGVYTDQTGQIIGTFNTQTGTLSSLLSGQTSGTISSLQGVSDQLSGLLGAVNAGNATLVDVFKNSTGQIVGGVTQNGNQVVGSLVSLDGSLTGTLTAQTTGITGGLVSQGAQVVAEFQTSTGQIVGGLVSQGGVITGVYTDQTGRIIGTFTDQAGGVTNVLNAQTSSLLDSASGQSSLLAAISSAATAINANTIDQTLTIFNGEQIAASNSSNYVASTIANNTAYLAGVIGSNTTALAGDIAGNFIWLYTAMQSAGVHTFAHGGIFSAGAANDNGALPLGAFTNTVVSQPTRFAFAQGGVMGEAGPEAILPLKRGPNGDLGVHASLSIGGHSSDALTVAISKQSTDFAHATTAASNTVSSAVTWSAAKIIEALERLETEQRALRSMLQQQSRAPARVGKEAA
jgi:hypothetical protein